MKLRILVYILMLILLGSPFVQAQDKAVCGVLTADSKPTASNPNLGDYTRFGPLDLPAGAILTVEATTAASSEIIGVIAVSGQGEVAYMSNAGDAPTAILAYYFPEATKAVGGEIIWKSAGLAENSFTLTIDCPGQVDTQQLSTLTPAQAPTDNQSIQAGSGVGVKYTEYNTGIEVAGTTPKGEAYVLAFVAPDLLAPNFSWEQKATLVAGSTTYGYAIYRLPDGRYQVNVGSDQEGKVEATIFDRLPATSVERYEFTPAK